MTIPFKNVTIINRESELQQDLAVICYVRRK